MMIAKMAIHDFVKTSVILAVTFVLLTIRSEACFLTSNSIGSVSPEEDFMLEVGSPLVVSCNLVLEKAKKHHPTISSKDILFKLVPMFGDRAKVIPSKFYRYPNDSTAQVFIKNASMDHNGKYSCYISTPQSSNPSLYRNRFVCSTGVTIGYPPQGIGTDDIQCESENWHNMTCTWQPKNNTIPTTYKFYYSHMGRGSNMVECVPQKNIVNQCFMTSDVGQKPVTNFYRQSTKYYYFKILGENMFGTSENMLQLNHYNYVRPHRPMQFFVDKTGQRSMRLEWLSPAGMEGFPVGLQYELSYQSQWDDDWITMLTNDETVAIVSLLPHTIYKLRLRCASASMKAESLALWSEYYVIQQTTESDVPRTPPVVTLGLFEEIQYNHSCRSVVVYWKHVLPQYRNGEDFQYRVSYVESGGMHKRSGTDDNTKTTKDFYVRFNNLSPQLSYDFNIRVGNSEGYLPNVFTKIHVLDEKSMLGKPSNFQVKMQKNDTYMLSWEPPATDANKVKSYTIFWCKQRTRYYNIRCGNPLDWKTVPAEQHKLTLYISDKKNTYYQFSLSSNSESSSSGMVWTACINGVVDRVSAVSVTPISSSSLNVSWNSACFEEKKLIIGYIVQYCKSISFMKCSGAYQKRFVNADSARLNGLDSYQEYIIRVAYIRGNNVSSEYSDPVTGHTLQGVPEPLEAPSVVDTENSTVTIMWEKAKKPNGRIVKYKVIYNGITVEVPNSDLPVYHLTLNESIFPYTEYDLSVAACTAVSCSKYKNFARARTAVAEPGIMEPPRYDIINDTYVLVFWKKPLLPNGKLDTVELMVDGYTKKDGEYQPKSFLYKFLGWRNKTYIVIECPLFDLDFEMQMYNISVRAGNIVGNETLYGIWSSKTRVNKCFPPVEGKWIAAIVGAVLSGIILIICILFFYFTRCRKPDSGPKKIILPIGLDSKSMINAYKDFSSGLKSSEINNGGCPETYGVYMPLVRNSTLNEIDSVQKHLDETNSTEENQDADDHSRNTECSDDSGTADLPNSKLYNSSNASNADLITTDDFSSNPPYCKLGFSHMRGPYIPVNRDAALFLNRKIAGSEPNIAEPSSPVDPDSGNSSVVHSVFPPYTQLGLASSHIDISKTVPVPVSYSEVHKNLSNMDPYVSMNNFNVQSDSASPNFFPASPYSKFGLLNIPTKESMEKNPGNPYVCIEPVRKWDIPKSYKGGIIPVQHASVTFNNPVTKVTAEIPKSPAPAEGYSVVSAIPEVTVPVPQNIENLPEPEPIICVPNLPGKSTGAIPKTTLKPVKNIPQKKLPVSATNGYIPCNPVTPASPSEQTALVSDSDTLPTGKVMETSLIHAEYQPGASDSYTSLSSDLNSVNDTATSTPRTSPVQLPKVTCKPNSSNSKTAGYVPNMFFFTPSSKDNTQPLSCANLPIL